MVLPSDVYAPHTLAIPQSPNTALDGPRITGPRDLVITSRTRFASMHGRCISVHGAVVEEFEQEVIGSAFGG